MLSLPFGVLWQHTKTSNFVAQYRCTYLNILVTRFSLAAISNLNSCAFLCQRIVYYCVIFLDSNKALSPTTSFSYLVIWVDLVLVLSQRSWTGDWFSSSHNTHTRFLSLPLSLWELPRWICRSHIWCENPNFRFQHYKLENDIPFPTLAASCSVFQATKLWIRLKKRPHHIVPRCRH